MNRETAIRELLCFRWGREYDKIETPTYDMQVINEPICVHCKKFSFFCSVQRKWKRGRNGLHAATQWRRSVIGFVPIRTASDLAGVATMRCLNRWCRRYFGFYLSSVVIEAYYKDSPDWQMAVIRRFSSGGGIHPRTMRLLRKFAGVKGATMSDIEVVSILDRREAEQAA